MSTKIVSFDTINHGSGDLYFGGTMNKTPHGMGMYEWADGDKYFGDFENGNRTGLGIFYKSNGETIVGEFINGELYGRGIYKWKNGDQYIGTFRDGLFDGKGQLTTKEGKYVGEFKNDQKHGKGRMFHDNNIVQEGVWKFDEFIIESSLKKIIKDISNTIYGSLNTFEIMHLSNDIKNQNKFIKNLAEKIEQKKLKFDKKNKISKHFLKKSKIQTSTNLNSGETYFQFEKFDSIKFLTVRFEKKWLNGEINPKKLRSENLKKGRLINHGLPATKQEAEELIKMYIEEKSFHEMEKYFQRTEYSIKKRLEGLGVPEDKLN